MSDDLLDRLAADLRPVPRNAVPLWFAGAVLVGALAGAAIMIPWLGLRSDFPAAFAMPVFWLKLVYPLLIGICGLVAVERLARPGLKARGTVTAVVGLVIVVAILGLIQLAASPIADARVLILGGTALLCPFYIVAISAPVFIATILVMRRLAPTRLTMAGLAAGLLAGGVGATVYSLHCGEHGLPFLAIWYTLGIAAVAAIGALSGRILLRW